MSNSETNIAELEQKGYKMSINLDADENYWEKNDVRISIHTIRSSPPEYFKGLLKQKEQFQFEVI